MRSKLAEFGVLLSLSQAFRACFSCLLLCLPPPRHFSLHLSSSASFIAGMFPPKTHTCCSRACKKACCGPKHTLKTHEYSCLHTPGTGSVHESLLRTSTPAFKSSSSTSYKKKKLTEGLSCFFRFKLGGKKERHARSRMYMNICICVNG